MSVLRVPLSGLVPGHLALPFDVGRYVTRVHRLGPGDAIVVFDPEAALEARATIDSLRGKDVWVAVEAPHAPTIVPRRKIHVVQALGKGDKPDATVRDATELGATAYFPAITASAIVQISAGDVASTGSRKRERWRRIAVEAARQCGRADVPDVRDPLSISDIFDLLGASDTRVGWCFDPAGDTPFDRAIEPLRAMSPSTEVVLVVGPEGGFTPEEIALARAAGFAIVRLGPFVLRTETVCAAALGALLALP